MNQITREILNLEHISLSNFLQLILDKENFKDITVGFLNNSALTKKQKAFLHDAVWIRKKEKASIEDGLKYYVSYMHEMCESRMFFENPILFLSDFQQCAIRVYFLSTKLKQNKNMFDDLMHSFDLITKGLPRNGVALIFLMLGNNEKIGEIINDWKNEILSESFLEFNNAYKNLYFLLVRKNIQLENCSSIFELILFLDGEEIFNQRKYLQVIDRFQKILPDKKTLDEIGKQAVQNYICTQERSNGYIEPEKWLYDIANQIGWRDKLNDFNIKNSYKKAHELDFKEISITTSSIENKAEDLEETFEEVIRKIIEISQEKCPNDLFNMLLNAGSVTAHSHYPTGETSPVYHSPYHRSSQDIKIKKLIEKQSLHGVSEAQIKALVTRFNANFVLLEFALEDMETCFIHIFDNTVNDFNKRLNINYLLFIHEVNLQQSKKGDKGLATRPKGLQTQIEKSKNYIGDPLEDYRNDAAHPKQSIRLGKHYLAFGQLLQIYSEGTVKVREDVKI